MHVPKSLLEENRFLYRYAHEVWEQGGGHNEFIFIILIFYSLNLRFLSELLRVIQSKRKDKQDGVLYLSVY